MVREFALRQVGGSIGATLPKAMANLLHLGLGVEAGLAIAAHTAKKFRNAMRELAR